MPFLYGSLARRGDGHASGPVQTGSEGGTILADYSTVKGNFRNVCQVCMQRFDVATASTATFEIDNYNATYIYEDGLMYGIVATDDIKRATLRAVASHLKSQFTKTKIDPQSIRMAQVDELKKSFAPKIKQLLEHANANPAYYDKVLTIQQNVVEVTNIVEKNVDKLLQQGEKLENLEIKTSELEAQTAMYHKAAKKLNQEVFWQNKKMMCVAISIAMLVLLVVAIVISAALGAFRL